jgi:hypothetical protein
MKGTKVSSISGKIIAGVKEKFTRNRVKNPITISMRPGPYEGPGPYLGRVAALANSSLRIQV